MKKYIKPETILVFVETQQMIAESVAITSTSVDADKAEGRGYSDWED